MKAWIWIFVVFAGSLPLASALQYYVAGEAYRNNPTRNWLVVAQAGLGILVILFGLYKQNKASRQAPPPDEDDTKLNLNDQ